MKGNIPLFINRKKISQSPFRQDLIYLVDDSKIHVTNSTTLVEKVLISKLRIGDSHAFSIIFTSYYKDLVFFAARFTKDLNSAEEIVQDAFVKLWEQHESINVTVSLKSYLLKTIQNKCIDWLRHKKIKLAHNNFVMEGFLQFEYDTDNYILHSELQEQIEAALNKLPEEISAVFRMSRYKGLKYYEIADLLGVSIRTVEVRIGRALHLLRNQLKDYLLIVIAFSNILFSSVY